ncbi:MAG: hypothetical protein RJS97_23075 [Parvibaculaceae bacterium]
MKFFPPALCTLVLLFGSLSGPLVARADGPMAPSRTPSAEAGQCLPIKGSTACKQTFRTFAVNKADGSGSTKVALIEDRTLSYSKIARTASTLGEPLFPKNDPYTKSSMEKSSYFGVMLDAESNIIEPALYRHILPVSDKVALAVANDVTRFYGKDSGYYTPVNKYYFVDLDGKLTKPEQPGIDPASLYYVGGYYSGLPAQVFEFIGRDEARGTVTLRQYDGYGRERAVFDNILLHRRKDNYDSFELSFYVNSQYDFVVSALHPETGEPASLWFKADGSVIGYRVSSEVRSTLEVGAKDRTQAELVELVGRLPIITELKDDRLYHPIDLNGERVAAPSNFIGMARMFYSRSSVGDVSTAQNYYRGWLLVYALPTGYGFKISDRASSSVHYPAIVSAEDVLLDEKRLKMLSGFGYSRIADGDLAMIVRPFDQYEADSVTPAQGALPTRWHRIFERTGSKFTATQGDLSDKSYGTSTEAFFAIGQDELADDREYARRQEVYQQERAALQAERAAERARREAELQAHFEREAAREAEYAKARSQYRPKTGAEEFNERIALMKSWDRRDRRDMPAGTQVCYDLGDASDFCFAY